jgi:hypothetical protein
MHLADLLVFLAYFTLVAGYGLWIYHRKRDDSVSADRWRQCAGTATTSALLGYEMLGEAQRDITPEIAAARLRNCSDDFSPRAKAWNFSSRAARRPADFNWKPTHPDLREIIASACNWERRNPAGYATRWSVHGCWETVYMTIPHGVFDRFSTSAAKAGIDFIDLVYEPSFLWI